MYSIVFHRTLIGINWNFTFTNVHQYINKTLARNIHHTLYDLEVLRKASKVIDTDEHSDCIQLDSIEP